MKHRITIYVCLLLAMSRIEAMPTYGVDTANSTFFREWYQSGDIVHYLDNMSDYVTYELETTGEWALPDQKVFSIRGNSYKWNKFYYQGFRIDSRFQEGSTLFHMNMQEQNLTLDFERGRLHILPDAQRKSQLWLSGNAGNLGGISPGTAEMIHLFHQTATDRQLKPITDRSHVIGFGQLAAGYAIPYKGKTAYQHIYANYGQRRQVACDETGIFGTYDAPYYAVQLDGDYPLVQSDWGMHYFLSSQHREDWNAEWNYAPQEQAMMTNYSASFFATRDTTFTTGVSYGVHRIRHHQLAFERNVVDQDGEGMEPWYADGLTHELNWAVNYKLPIREWLHFEVDGYNSLMLFRPTTDSWSNRLYARYEGGERTDYYDYQFSSQAFAAGILENEARLSAHKTFTKWFTLYGDVAVALDGIVLRDKHLVMPSWEAMVGLAFHPAKWFDAEIIVGNFRTRYGWNMVQLLSSDYLNMTSRYVVSERIAEQWGGNSIQVEKGLQQPQYVVLDIPIRFTIAGAHEIAILSTARKYYNCQTIAATDNGGYILTARPAVVEAGGLYNTPFYMSNTIRYTYSGKKVFFSLSWQSYQMSGTSLIGNGPMANNVDALSFSMARQETNTNASNSISPVRTLGRYDQDRAYICRLQLGANITENWGLSLNFHFKDGTPFCNYLTEERINMAGDKDIVILPGDTKGINVSDGHFGRRKDAFFNLDIRLRYQGNINMRNQALGAQDAIPFELQLTGYNLYDFGTELTEYCFDQELTETRRALTLCIPRGIMATFSIGLERTN